MITIKSIEKIVYESVKAINEIAIKDSYNKTDCLNVQYNSGRIHASMELLEVESMDRFIEIHEEIKDTMQIGLEVIDNIYK